VTGEASVLYIIVLLQLSVVYFWDPA